MKLPLTNLKIKGLGKRRLTEFDFYHECMQRGFKVYECPQRVSGITSWQSGLVVIAINSELHGEERLHAMWHEFAHAVLHAPFREAGVLFCESRPGRKPKAEIEAEAFANIALGKSID